MTREKEFENLCRELNMDKETEENAWKRFCELSRRFLFEDNLIHWYCCALYAASRESYTPTVGESKAIVIGNCVSLNKLLRSCEMSIYDFIIKIKKWHEMANLSHEFLERIELLERTATITFNVFQDFKNIFEKFFKNPVNDKKNTKYRSAAKCSSNKLYNLCWCLYLCAKNENRTFLTDLITSRHLLICCMDLIYINVLAENRLDLINMDSEAVSLEWNTTEFRLNRTKYSIIDVLCEITNIHSIEPKTLKQNFWEQIIKGFFETKTLRGDSEIFLGIVSNQNFDHNLKSLNSSYEQYILSVGEFDERILLNTQLENKSLISSIRCKEVPSDPTLNVTNTMKKLQDIARTTEPPGLIREAGSIVLNKIIEKLDSMSKLFISNFPNQIEANKLFPVAKSLYFYLCEKIIQVETRMKPNIDIKILLDIDSFNTTLIACCVEIVLNANNCQQKFPWTLNCFSINAFNFCKIIEIVVRSHDDILTRDFIKHLNLIEDTCLESLAWRSTSSIWDLINIGLNPLPTWFEVDVGNKNRKTEQQQSPMNSAYETFRPPVISDSAKRDLFNISRDITRNESFSANTCNQLDVSKRSGSLSIFLRKFYKLAWFRIKKLCSELGKMGNESDLNKIWTLFEYSITKKTKLMQNRHLDQILMCAIYLYIRVGEFKLMFTDIMKLYRKQSQATSSTYREVLIKEALNTNVSDCKPEYKDIIYFYNNIYVQEMTDFALNFSEKRKSQRNPLLSPHPTEKQFSPRKLSNNHSFYVGSLEKNEVSHSPEHFTYQLGKSPAKDLERMNEIVRKGKRNLPFDDDISLIDCKILKENPSYIGTITKIIRDREEN